jgi:hypothetical protein
MFNYVPIKHKQMSFVSNGGKFKLYTVLNGLLFPIPTQPWISFERQIHTVSFFLRLAIGFYMLIFQPPVNFCSDENIQTIFGTKLEDLINYRIDYNSISQTVEKVVKKIFLAR